MTYSEIVRSLVQDKDVSTNRLGSPQIPAKGLAGFRFLATATTALLPNVKLCPVGADDLLWRVLG
ncbi:hypothetical protein ASD64_19825 [Mesorhizobium sp. Root157]|nr:hypothetical protein ASD64_19825 [Mesorhizobium sp. Root157]